MDTVAEVVPKDKASCFTKDSLIALYKSWVFYFLFIFIFFVPLLLTFLLIFPPFWIVGVPYLCWMWIDRKTPSRGGRKNRYLQNLRIWKFCRDYFPIKLIKTCELPADKNYLFCAFPHGNLPLGIVSNFATGANDFEEHFPGIDVYTITLNGNFYVPFYREIILSQGLIAASEESIKRILNGPHSSSCVLIVGGTRESIKAFKTSPGEYDIVLKNRKGFVRVALKTGHGRGFFQKFVGFFPLKSPISTVVGNPIDVPKIENPTQEDIDKYHSIFMKELEELFNKYKEKFDPYGNNAILKME